MSQHINHRREGLRHQDHGPAFESQTPNAGANSCHVASSRAAWKRIGSRAERRTGHKSPKVFVR